jgi:hypothetical protein
LLRCPKAQSFRKMFDFSNIIFPNSFSPKYIFPELGVPLILNFCAKGSLAAESPLISSLMPATQFLSRPRLSCIQCQLQNQVGARRTNLMATGPRLSCVQCQLQNQVGACRTNLRVSRPQLSCVQCQLHNTVGARRTNFMASGPQLICVATFSVSYRIS